MLTYHEYERAVYVWLMKKHEKDNSFTFSVRQKGTKNARRDYFIGKEDFRENHYGYFGTTFWNIPVASPQKATDLINLMFTETDSRYQYSFQFNQVKDPHNEQNRWALELIQNLREPIKEAFDHNFYGSAEKSKSENFGLRSKHTYDSLDEMLISLEKDLKTFIPLVNQYVKQLKESHPKVKAERFTIRDFDEMQEGLKRRLKKYPEPGGDPSPGGGGDPGPGTDEEDNDSPDHTVHPINQILFGPPGTGKTYNASNKALAIVENCSEEEISKRYPDRVKLKKRFDELLITDWDKADGQIAFITFHQSMSYEDFIEGIKPLPPIDSDDFVKYDIEDGIFKSICQIAGTRRAVLTFNEAYDKLFKEIRGGRKFILKTGTTNKPFEVQIANNNQDLFAIPQTGKNNPNPVNKISLKDYVDNNILGHWKSYVKPVGDLLKEKYYSLGANYVLIIDEINRGNVSQIFGELITLIEKDKRLGQHETLETILPYSKKKFGVPPNIYIIGTMNTADRSVEALDSALRRRFSFVGMPPATELVSPENQLWQMLNDERWHNEESEQYADIEKYEQELIELLGIELDYQKLPDSFWAKYVNIETKEERINMLTDTFEFDLRLDALLSKVNSRIEKLLDNDHLIGHSYFMKVKSWQDLISAFYNEIIPLLREYFYGDFGKIGLVLGKGFIKKKDFKLKKKQKLFADFDYETQGLDERDVYEIVDYRDENVIHSIKLTETVPAEEEGKEATTKTVEKILNFEEALKILMK